MSVNGLSRSRIVNPIPDLTSFNTDRSATYIRNYLEVCAHLVGRETTILEMGVLHRDSLRLWKAIFPEAVVVGIDQVQIEGPFEKGTKFYQGLQQDTDFLDRVANEEAPNGFDLIIDDASHVAEEAMVAFDHLFHRHLKPGGVYSIEDWGTGYWEDWPDGAFYAPPAAISPDGTISSHQAGMVGLVKSLTDRVGTSDILRGESESAISHKDQAEKLIIFPGQAFLIKIGNEHEEGPVAEHL